jgi:5'-phosphate synthase pdxT subunit
VVGLQGAVSEHIASLERAFFVSGEAGEAVWVRRREDLERVDCLVLPGGESTTISKLLVKFGLFDLLKKRAEQGMPMLGTCAGMIVMCERGDEEVDRTDTRLLGLLTAEVDRNAFGRQRESFEADLDVEGLSEPLHAVFIRAPAVVRTWGDCRPIARLGERVVMVRQGHLLAASFHPELTNDLRVHMMLLDMV